MKRFLFLSAVGVFLFFSSMPRTANAGTHALVAYQAAAQDPATTTFTGTIVKSGATFSLTDDKTSMSYKLDDAKKASQFEGKKVQVTGTLDAQNQTIHVQSISEAS